MKRIGIISDTHTFFDDKLRTFLKDTDLILHAGDIGNLETADSIASFKPLAAVYGNIDDARVRVVYPREQFLQIEGVDIFMTHIGGYPGKYESAALETIDCRRPDIFISGHSHILKVMPDKKRGLLHINPGGAGIYGFHHVRTAVRLIIDNGKICELEVGEWKKGL